jgi:hypothetical protein
MTSMDTVEDSDREKERAGQLRELWDRTQDSHQENDE